MSLVLTPRLPSRSTRERIARVLASLAGPLLAVGVLAGCTPTVTLDVLCSPGSGCETVSGVVVSVEGQGPASVDRFTLRTADGDVLIFDVGRLVVVGGGKPAPHLREHQVSGQPVVVEYKVENERNVAVFYTDAQ